MSGLGNILHQRQLNDCQSDTSIGYVAVPIKDFQDLLGLIDPPPVKTPDGAVMVFVNPHSAEVLTRISAIVRRMQDAALAHRVAAAPQAAGDFKSWDAGAHEWWKAHDAAQKGGAQ